MIDGVKRNDGGCGATADYDGSYYTDNGSADDNFGYSIECYDTGYGVNNGGIVYHERGNMLIKNDRHFHADGSGC